MRCCLAEKIESKMENAYVLGLVSGLSAKLVSSREFNQMMESKNLDEALSMLDGTTYRDVARVQGLRGIRPFDEAIMYSFEKTYLETTSFLSEKDRHNVDVLFTWLSDLSNIKTAARAVSAKTGKPPFFPSFGLLKIKDLEDALKSQDLKDMSLRLPLGFSEIFSSALESKDNVEFEETLDRLFLGRMLAKTDGAAREYVGILIDAYNIKAYLACKLSEIDDVRPHLMDGGHYLGDIIFRISALDIQGFIKAISHTPYAQAVSLSVSGGDLGSIHLLDSNLGGAVLGELRRKAWTAPFSIYPLIHYLRMKQEEASSVRAVVFGKYFGLEADDMRGMIS
jgi:vacuolar-type H+-ATPase subunit C/Vma6